MSCEFDAVAVVSKQLYAALAASAPANPFYTSRYIEAKRALGFQPWVLTLRQHGQLLAVCAAFMKGSVLHRSLEIPSLPALPDSEKFWEGLQQLCRKARIAYLVVNSSASPASTCFDIPALPGEINRRKRCEYVLALQQPDLWKQLASNHLRNIRRGHKTGLQMRRAVNAQACQEHASLVRASMERRQSRGEAVSTRIMAQSFVTYTRHGAGELFQAVHDGKVLASILILLAERGAYYQSAGTSPAGMACGASHFLVYEIAKSLQDRAIELFNLGGTEPQNVGLARFKAGFGASQVELEAAGFFVGSRAQKKIIMAARLLRHGIRLRSRGEHVHPLGRTARP
jgi:hypothetical protein